MPSNVVAGHVPKVVRTAAASVALLETQPVRVTRFSGLATGYHAAMAWPKRPGRFAYLIVQLLLFPFGVLGAWIVASNFTGALRVAAVVGIALFLLWVLVDIVLELRGLVARRASAPE